MLIRGAVFDVAARDLPIKFAAMRAPRYLLVPFALVIAVSSLRADGWMQLGRSSRHDGNVSVPGQSLDRVLANVTLDPFTDLEEATAGGELLAHYQAPLVDGDDVFIEIKGGTYAGFQSWSSETWTVRDLRWSGDTLAPRWTFTTDWTPVPPGSKLRFCSVAPQGSGVPQRAAMYLEKPVT